jgi:nucleoside-diphosphate-sugar epimerase
MKVLVTGDRGYIGSVLTTRLLTLGCEVHGIDVGFFDDCTVSPVVDLHQSISKDIRGVEREDLVGFDAIIHLAGLSNDPLGDLDESITYEINYHASCRLFDLASTSGVKRFIYSSSQSMYGISPADITLSEDDSVKNPATAYAKSKWQVEEHIFSRQSNGMQVVALRPSTVFGPSPRLRCDIVFNSLLGSGFSTGKIEIKSDGTPIRPVVNIDDVCSAFVAALYAPSKLVNGRSFNVGVPNGNYTVKDLAEAASRLLAGCPIIYTGEHGSDSRTYRVSFDRILTELSPYYVPRGDLYSNGLELLHFFKNIRFTDSTLRGAQTNRLVKVKQLLESGKVDHKLRVIK